MTVDHTQSRSLLESLGIEPPNERSLLDHVLAALEDAVLLDVRPTEGMGLSPEREDAALRAYVLMAEDVVASLRSRVGMPTPGHEYRPFRVLLDYDERSGAALLLEPNNGLCPFVVCHGYDPVPGEWASGSYFAALDEAMREYDGQRDVSHPAPDRELFGLRDLGRVGIDAAKIDQGALEELLDRANENMWESLDWDAQYSAAHDALRSMGIDWESVELDAPSTTHGDGTGIILRASARRADMGLRLREEARDER